MTKIYEQKLVFNVLKSLKKTRNFSRISLYITSKNGIFSQIELLTKIKIRPTIEISPIIEISPKIQMFD
mgnify:CR=1 FL=1